MNTKIIKLILSLNLLALSSAYAVEQLWQVSVDDSVSVLAGNDGSGVVASYSTPTNGLIWYSSDGSEIHTEDLGDFIADSFMYISSSLIVAELTYYNPQLTGFDGPNKVLILKANANGVTSQTLQGNTVNLERSSFPYIATKDGGIMTMYKIDEAGGSGSPFVSIPNNAVVIPTSYNGSFDIILETSGDLVNWTPALPGEYNTASSSGRFFRVRAINK